MFKINWDIVLRIIIFMIIDFRKIKKDVVKCVLVSSKWILFVDINY